MGFFGNPKEQAIQLRFRDDGKFEFRKLDMESTFIVEKQEGMITKGWKHFFNNQFPFAGYKNIPSGLVTLSYDRDIILDPYGLIDHKERPDYQSMTIALSDGVTNNSNGNGHNKMNGSLGIVPWLVDVGHAQRLTIIAKRNKNSNGDKIIYFLGFALMIELLIILLRVALGAM